MYLSFNFSSSFYSVFKVGYLVLDLFAFFKLFKDFLFNGNFCNTLLIGFCSVLFALKFEYYFLAF